MATVRRTFAFDDARDADLLARLDALPDGERSGAVRAGLRLYFEQAQSEPGLADVLAEVAAVRVAIDDLARRGVAVAGDEPAVDDLDPDILNNLLNLGLD